MKNNSIFVVALVSISNLFCCEKPSGASPVAVASKFRNSIHKEGDGHKIVALTRLVRSQSEGKLGAENLDEASLVKLLAKAKNVDLVTGNKEPKQRRHSALSPSADSTSMNSTTTLNEKLVSDANPE